MPVKWYDWKRKEFFEVLASLSFAPYVPDNETILNNCFEFDWECSKITKIVKSIDDQNKIKVFLRSNYK